MYDFVYNFIYVSIKSFIFDVVTVKIDAKHVAKYYE